MLFKDRVDAGRKLAPKLAQLAGPDTVVLGLARGGVPVAAEVARALAAPLDAFVVRKIGAPGCPEYAVGAVASGGTHVYALEAVRELGLTLKDLAYARLEAETELERREALYRRGRPPLDLASKIVIVVDDGLATGTSMTAAVQAIRRLDPRRVIVGAPVSSPEACVALGKQAHEVVCLETPSPFRAVGDWYDDFEQTSDEEVRRLLAAAAPLDKGQPARYTSGPWPTTST